MQLPYKGLGIGASGHWSFRMHKAMQIDRRVRYWSGVGLAPYHARPTLRLLFNIPESRYFRIGENDPIPPKAFEGCVWAHVASPNVNHERQTIQCVENGLITVTEKTLAVTPERYQELLNFLKKNGYARMVRPRRHYLEKPLTRILTEVKPRILDSSIKKHGKIVSVHYTYFETKPDDPKRKHVFSPRNGGIVTDWSHPQAITSKTLGAKFIECSDTQLYITNPYLDSNPTGYFADYIVKGERFVRNAHVVIRAEKGHASGINHKTARFVFEDGWVLDLTYVSTEKEYEGLTGFWRLFDPSHPQMEFQIGMPKGPLSNVVLIGEVVGMIKGKKPNFTIDDDRKIFNSVQMFYETQGKKKVIKNSKQVDKFLQDGQKDAPMIREVRDYVS